MNKISIVVFLYAFLAILEYSGGLAYWQNKYPTIAEKSCREDIANSVFLAIWPLGPIMVPFHTGFYEYGFQFTCGVKGK